MSEFATLNTFCRKKHILNRSRSSGFKQDFGGLETFLKEFMWVQKLTNTKRIAFLLEKRHLLELATHYLIGLAPNPKKILHNSGKQIRITEGM